MEDKHVTARETSGPAARRPALINTVFELGFPLQAISLWLRAISYPWPRVQERDAKVALLIPGFMAGDSSLAPLANFLRWLGHRAVYAGIWSNSRCPRETLEGLAERLTAVSAERRQRLVIIGQSLGGTYARALSARFPDCVERVITLGAPIRYPRDSVTLAVDRAVHMMATLRRLGDGCFTESCPCGASLLERNAGDVPTTVIYSRTDGIVHWQSCIDRSGSPLVDNVEVMTSHIGMGLNVDVYRQIAHRLTLPRREGQVPPRIGTSPAASKARTPVSNVLSFPSQASRPAQ